MTAATRRTGAEAPPAGTDPRAAAASAGGARPPVAFDRELLAKDWGGGTPTFLAPHELGGLMAPSARASASRRLRDRRRDRPPPRHRRAHLDPFAEAGVDRRR